MTKYLSSIILFSFASGVVASGDMTHHPGGGVSSSKSSLPYPFEPPSEKFCETNTLGDDAYLSFFKPCEFKFYKTDLKPNHFSCDGYDSAELIQTEERKVVMWPDSCVANGPRCYSLAEYPSLVNFTAYEDTEFAMEFPSEATVVSVNCEADYVQAQKFLENLPEELEDVASAIGHAATVFLVVALLCIVACVICCLGMCFRGRGPRHLNSNYDPVPATVIHSSYHDQPVIKATV